jgi:uncharacterized membrane protein
MDTKKTTLNVKQQDMVGAITAMLARHWIMLTVLAMVITFGLALWLSRGVSVWFDENYSIMVAQRPVGELVALTAVDAHPPLYYLLLKAWGSLFNWNELALRSLSALFGALSVGAMTLLMRRLFTRNVVVAVLPFMVFAPFLLRYDYEIRMYSLVTLIGILATWALVRAQQTRKLAWWIGYGLLVATGMYTLYMSAVIWLAHLVWLMVIARQRNESIIRQPYWIAYGVAAIALLPWLPTVVHQLVDSALPPMGALTLVQLVSVLGLMLGYVASWQVDAWLSLGIIVFIVLFTMLYVRVWKHASAHYRRGILLLAFGFAVGMVFYAMLSLPPMTPRFNERYVTHIAPYAYVLIGVIIALGWRMGWRRLAGGLAALSLVLLVSGVMTLQAVGNYNFLRAQSPKGKEVVAMYGCNDTTFISNDLFEYVDMSYEFRECDLRFYAASNPAFKHGYAPLHDSTKRVTGTETLSAKRIVVISYDEALMHVIPDARYRLVASDKLDQVAMKVYER